MPSTACIAAYALVLITLPIIVLLWATESPKQRAKRLRAAGHIYRAIAERLHVSPTTARRYCLS